MGIIAPPNAQHDPAAGGLFRSRHALRAVGALAHVADD